MVLSPRAAADISTIREARVTAIGLCHSCQLCRFVSFSEITILASRLHLNGATLTLGPCGKEWESAQATISLTNEARDQPRTTEVALAADSTDMATLTTESNGQGCTVADFPYPPNVQVIGPNCC